MDTYLKPSCTTISTITSFMYLVAIVTPVWININGGAATGLFESTHTDTTQLFPTVCNSNMSELECGYLQCAKVAAIVTMLFSATASFMFFHNTTSFSRIFSFLSVILSIITWIFGLMTAVIFYYFEVNYYDDDGINQENTSTPLLSLNFSYYLWVVAVVLTFVISVVGYLELRKKRFQ